VTRSWVRGTHRFARVAPAVILVAVVESVEAEVVARAAKIAPGDSLVVQLEAPSVSLALEFDARLEATSFSGSTFALGVTVNGVPVTSDRLTNKRNVFATAARRLLTWGDAARWRLVYSPDFSEARNAPGSPHQILGTTPFHFTLDVSDMPASGRNRIVFRHLDTRLPAIALRDVRTGPGGRPTTPAVAKSTQASPAAAPLDSLFEFALLPGGGVEFHATGLSGMLETEVSIPRGGWRRLSREASGWQAPSIDRRGARFGAKEVAFARRVRRHAYALEVRDVIENRTTADLGLIVRSRIRLDPRAVDVFLAGTLLPPDPLEIVAYEPQAPSVVAVTRNGAVGMLPANDVAWIHAESFRDSAGVGLTDANLCIPARDSVALAWWVIPRPGGGYRDWLDVARTLLGVDRTIPAGFAFGSFEMPRWSPERLRDWIRVRGVKFVATPAPSSSGSHGLHGPALLGSPKAQESLRRFAAAVHAAAPDVQALAYFHSFLVNAEATVSAYEPQRLRVANGAPLAYPRQPSQARYEVVVPVPGSAFATDLERVLDLLWDLGFDGIYWDEMSYSTRAWTYGPDWDRVSGDVDPTTHLLVRRKSAVPLLVQSWVMDQVADVEERHKALVANTEPATFTMHRYGFPRFVETALTSNLLATHLGSPVGLGDRVRQRDQTSVARGVWTHLEHGVLYYYYSPAAVLTAPNVTSWMYPATPLRLRDGTIWARERILTSRSGRFGWDDLSRHEVHVFDANGAPAAAVNRTFEHDGVRWTEVDLAPGWVAAIVRGAPP
jgi:hypothetical protein